MEGMDLSGEGGYQSMADPPMGRIIGLPATPVMEEAVAEGEADAEAEADGAPVVGACDFSSVR